MLQNVFSQLLTIDASGAIVSDLTESYKVSDDGTEYTFKLRKDVKWHDGTNVTADDVVFTVEKWQTEIVGYSVKLIVEKAEKIDDYTVKFKLYKPDRTFLNHLSSGLYIVQEKAYSADPVDYKIHPIGSGPYKAVSHEVSTEFKLTRFDDYYGEPAPIKDITVKIIPDNSTLTAALEAGEVDFAIAATASVPILEKEPNVNLVERPITLTWFVTFNNEKGPFDNKLLRQAVAYGLNRQGIIDIAFDGIGIPADAMMTDNLPYKPDIKQHYEYNIEKAKELMAEAGYPDGLTVEEPLIYFSYQKKAAEVIQAQLAEIGITVTMEGMDIGPAMEKMRAGDYVIGLSG